MEKHHRRPLTSVCESWSHPPAWELQLLIDSQALQMSSVFRGADARSAAAMIQTIDEWRTAVPEVGLRDAPRFRTEATDPGP